MAVEKTPLEMQMDEAKKKANQPIAVKSATGELTSINPASTGQAAAALGQPVPTTPLSVAGTGMNPNAAKMAGTPNQLAGANQQNLLSTQQREQQGRTQTTADEQAKLEKSQNLQNLGSLGDRVQNLINSNISANEIQPVQLSLNQKDAQGNPIAATPEQTALQTAINSQDPTQVNTALATWANAEKAAGRPVDFSTVASMFGSPEQALSTALQSGLQDTIKVDENAIKGLGYTDLNDFKDKTGIDIPPGTTLAQLQNSVSQAVTSEFSENERLKKIAFDPNSSVAERSSARQSLIDNGSLKLNAAEEQAHQLETKVANADEVQFMGGTHKLDDLLNDQNFTGLVSKALNDPATMEKLKQTNPDIASFIQSNGAALKEVTDQIPQATDSFQQMQDQYKSLNKVGSTTMNASVMAALYPGYNADQFVSSLPQANGNVATYMNGLSDTDKATFADSLNKWGEADAGLVQGLQKLNSQQLNMLFNTPGGQEASSAFQAYYKNPKDPYLASVFKGMGPGQLKDLNSPGVQQKLHTAMAQSYLSIPPGTKGPKADAANTVLANPKLLPLIQDKNLTSSELLNTKFTPNDLDSLLALKNLSPSMNNASKASLDNVLNTVRTANTNDVLKNMGLTSSIDKQIAHPESFDGHTYQITDSINSLRALQKKNSGNGHIDDDLINSKITDLQAALKAANQEHARKQAAENTPGTPEAKAKKQSLIQKYGPDVAATMLGLPPGSFSAGSAVAGAAKKLGKKLGL